MILKKFPHPIILVLLLIFVAAGLTYVLPSGSYDRELNEISGREVVVPGTYHETDSSPISFFDIWVSIPRALSETSEVIFLVFLIGGAFVVVEKTSALNQGVYFLTNKIKGNSNLIIVFVSILFTLAGAMNNTQEEIVAVIPVLVILTGSFGLKPQVAVAMSTGSAIIGAAFSPINPFQVGIAQKLAQVELFSGALYRGIFLLIGMSLWIVILIRYANKTKRIIPEGNNEIQEKLSKKSLLIFLLVATTFGVMVIGILNWDWDFNQMAAPFVLMALVVGLIGDLKLEGTINAYLSGIKEMVPSGLLIGFAMAISLVMKEGNILDTIVYYLVLPIQNVSEYMAVFGMYIVHSILHIPVPSVSGQAALTMPLMIPASDLLGINRQVAILAYQYGAGLTDMLTPTNGALMAVLIAAKVNYNEWIKFILPKFLIIMALAFLSLFISMFFFVFA